MLAFSTRNSCPVKSLTITAVEDRTESISTVGKRLSSFVDSIRLYFEFKTVIIADIDELNEEMFEVEEEEADAVYSAMHIDTLLVNPIKLDNLMRIVQKLRPCVVTVQEVEAELNSKCFVKRFTEALFYYNAMFDSLEGRERERERGLAEEYAAEGIRSVVGREGKERRVRHVGVRVWRKFFARYGLVEMGLSEWSMYQAELVGEEYVKEEVEMEISLERNGESLLCGWKGRRTLRPRRRL